MSCQLGYSFQLKVGTALSKEYRNIHRFSEDIDIHIQPSIGIDIKIGHHQIQSRKHYYDWLAKNIQIGGIISINRDSEFENEKYRSRGISAYYTEI